MPAFSAIASAIGIRGFAAISAGLLALVFWLGWDHAAHQRDDQIRRNGELDLKLATSNQSIETLQAVLTQKNAESEARAKAYQDSQKLAADDAQRLKKQAQASDGQIARLRALAASGDKSGCEASPELLNNLEGL